ncbi:MAG: type II secretion system F family protein [Actinomycetia bacterium]|nr:type II secretion system F family protein [Actinomycetes bacterium]
MKIYFIVIGCYILFVAGFYFIFLSSPLVAEVKFIKKDRSPGILKTIVSFLNNIVHRIGVMLGRTGRGKETSAKNRILEILEYEKDLHITPEAFFGYKLVSASLLIIGGGYIGDSLLYSILFGMMGGAIGYFIPDMIVNRFAAKISEDIDKELSYVIDLLSISTLSGQNIYNSFSILIEKYNGRICYDLRNFIRDVDMGAGKDYAYRRLIEVSRSKQFRELMSVLMEADRYGSPISGILIQRSRQISFENWDNAERKAKKISLLSLLPLIFLILPAFMLLVGGPLIFSLASGVFF